MIGVRDMLGLELGLRLVNCLELSVLSSGWGTSHSTDKTRRCYTIKRQSSAAVSRDWRLTIS